jgi:hypothetical protein
MHEVAAACLSKRSWSPFLQREFNLIKPSAYHYDFLLLGGLHFSAFATNSL